MSQSPPVQRFQTTGSTGNRHEELSRQEELINAYEAEEERIINLLSRKLEQLREEKIDLENALEAESESHVNRLSRELTALRAVQQNGGISASPSSDARSGLPGYMTVLDPNAPTPDVMLDAMRRENEQLRNKLVDTERDYIRISRLNEIYREELIEHRRKLGIPVDSLIGLPSADPYSQPTHRRSISSGSSPSSSILLAPPRTYASQPPNGLAILRPADAVPIPRAATQHQRPTFNGTSEGNTPLSHSPASSDSPFPFSPVTSADQASFASGHTNLTTPPSSASLTSNLPSSYSSSMRTLSYPSVPPPSLSSSFGSPPMLYHILHRDPSGSPNEGPSRRESVSHRRGSIGFDRGVVQPSHGLRPGAVGPGSSHSSSRRASIERGARVAETGQLVPRSRAGSQSVTLPSTEEVSPPATENRASNGRP